MTKLYWIGWSLDANKYWAGDGKRISIYMNAEMVRCDDTWRMWWLTPICARYHQPSELQLSVQSTRNFVLSTLTVENKRSTLTFCLQLLCCKQKLLVKSFYAPRGPILDKLKGLINISNVTFVCQMLQNSARNMGVGFTFSGLDRKMLFYNILQKLFVRSVWPTLWEQVHMSMKIHLLAIACWDFLSRPD